MSSPPRLMRISSHISSQRSSNGGAAPTLQQQDSDSLVPKRYQGDAFLLLRNFNAFATRVIDDKNTYLMKAANNEDYVEERQKFLGGVRALILFRNTVEIIVDPLEDSIILSKEQQSGGVSDALDVTAIGKGGNTGLSSGGDHSISNAVEGSQTTRDGEDMEDPTQRETVTGEGSLGPSLRKYRIDKPYSQTSARLKLRRGRSQTAKETNAKV